MATCWVSSRLRCLLLLSKLSHQTQSGEIAAFYEQLDAVVVVVVTVHTLKSTLLVRCSTLGCSFGHSVSQSKKEAYAAAAAASRYSNTRSGRQLNRIARFSMTSIAFFSSSLPLSGSSSSSVPVYEGKFTARASESHHTMDDRRAFKEFVVVDSSAFVDRKADSDSDDDSGVSRICVRPREKVARSSVRTLRR